MFLHRISASSTYISATSLYIDPKHYISHESNLNHVFPNHSSTKFTPTSSYPPASSPSSTHPPHAPGSILPSLPNPHIEEHPTHDFRFPGHQRREAENLKSNLYRLEGLRSKSLTLNNMHTVKVCLCWGVGLVASFRGRGMRASGISGPSVRLHLPNFVSNFVFFLVFGPRFSTKALYCKNCCMFYNF